MTSTAANPAGLSVRELRRRKRRVWIARRLALLGLLRPRAGHFYSPLASKKEVRRDASRIFDRSLRDIPGVDVNSDGQLALLDHLAPLYADQPFGHTPSATGRYFPDNFYYGVADAVFLHLMIRHARPSRIVEVGSGFSSAVMLDTNELFFQRAIRLTFVEPHIRRLHSLLREDDLPAVDIVEKRIQDVGPALVEQLRAGDIFFVDSSHVSKVGSDVNYILFELLPRLAPGVFIHFHDVPYPFEYPREWFEFGFSWNEPYALRAFLQYNNDFTIRLWNDFLMRFHPDALAASMPLCATPLDFGVGGSLWLQRTGGQGAR